MKTSLILTSLLALAGSAMADMTIGYSQSVSGTGTDADGDHTVLVTVGDDGSVVILVDGQPLSLPGAPEAPELPDAPEAPSVPETPAVPELPPLPALP